MIITKSSQVACNATQWIIFFICPLIIHWVLLPAPQLRLFVFSTITVRHHTTVIPTILSGPFSNSWATSVNCMRNKLELSRQPTTHPSADYLFFTWLLSPLLSNDIYSSGWDSAAGARLQWARQPQPVQTPVRHQVSVRVRSWCASSLYIYLLVVVPLVPLKPS